MKMLGKIFSSVSTEYLNGNIRGEDLWIVVSYTFSKEKGGLGTLLISQKTYLSVSVEYSFTFYSFKQVREKMCIASVSLFL